MKEIATILSAFSALPVEMDTVALATVVDVSGSSYRRPGARMLILPSGQTHGAVSGGCLEADIIERAHRVMRTSASVLVKYDTTEDGDIVFGLGLGCQGVVQVLIEPIPIADYPSYFTFLTEVVMQRQPGVVATVFSGTAYPERLMLRNNGSIASNIDDAQLERFIERDAKTAFAAGKSCSRQYDFPDGRANVFFEFLKPPKPLLICGAGHDAEPLARFAAELGWHITVVDPRPAYAIAGRFPSGASVICARPEALNSHVKIEASTAVVLMTHNYYHDRAFLETVLSSAASYIGILGPKRRAERLFQDLRAGGLTITLEDYQRLHCPIGLDIGADAPEQIALSIIAEIQAESAGRCGNQLRDRRGPIYDPTNDALVPTDDQSWAEPLRGEMRACPVSA